MTIRSLVTFWCWRWERLQLLGAAGAEEFTLPFRTIADANRLRRRMTEALDALQPDAAPKDTRSALTFAIVGGGASGFELSTRWRISCRDAVKRRALRGEARVISSRWRSLLPGMVDEMREHVDSALEYSRVEVHTTPGRASFSGPLTIEHNGVETEIKRRALFGSPACA